MKGMLLLAGLLMWSLLCEAQARDKNNGRQVEQLQQLRNALTRKIDSLQQTLPALAGDLALSCQKVESLKQHNQSGKTNGVKPVAFELQKASSQVDSLRQIFDTGLRALDRNINLRKSIEEKIVAIQREGNL